MRGADNPGIFRAGNSGLNEELVYHSDDTGLFFFPFRCCYFLAETTCSLGVFDRTIRTSVFTE